MRHFLLLLLPAALLAQAPLVWRSDDGKAFTQGPSGHLVPYHAPVTLKSIRWSEYGLYVAAVAADYASTQYALNHGARETFPLYQCSPSRPGCIDNSRFIALSAIPPVMWLLNDLWLHKWMSPRAQRIHRIIRKVRIGMHFGAAAYNLGIGQGMKTR